MDVQDQTGTIDSKKDFDKSPDAIWKRWMMELEVSHSEEDGWRKDARYALDRYRGHQASARGGRQRIQNNFNILYSNTEIMAGSMLGDAPRPIVRRRFSTDNEAGKTMAQVLERSLSHQMDEGELYDTEAPELVEDYLLPGRAVGRIRYLPTVAEGERDATTPKALMRLLNQSVRFEGVQWDDFRHGPGRRWREVPWIAFRHLITKDDAKEQFPDKADEIDQASYSFEGDYSGKKDRESDSIPDVMKRLEFWEIWDRADNRVKWLCSTIKSGLLDEQDDPLNLKGFFCVPRPAVAVKDPDSLVPTTLFSQYRVQADHLNELQRRIIKLTKVMKAVGIYDSTMAEVKKLRDLDDGQLVPTVASGAIAERGGIGSAIWMMPITDMANVLQMLFQARAQAVQEIYEITGISDILRGATNANETATAQQIKATAGGQRFGRHKKELSRMIRDGVRMMAEVIAEKFEPSILAKMTDTPLEEIMPLMEEMQDDVLRSYMVDIETEATEAEQMAMDKQAISELVGAITELLTTLGPAVQQGMLPPQFISSLIKAATHKFSLGRDIDDAMDLLEDHVTQMMEQQQGQSQGVPEEQVQQMVEQAMQQGLEQGKQQGRDESAMQIAQIKAQSDQALKQLDADVKRETEGQKTDAQISLEREKLDFEREKLDADLAIKQRQLDQKDDELDIKRKDLDIREQDLQVRRAASETPEEEDEGAEEQSPDDTDETS